MIVMPFASIEGIDSNNDFLFSAFVKSVETTSDLSAKFVKDFAAYDTLTESGYFSIAFNASLKAANSILAAMAASCNLDSPPASVNIESDNDGTLVYRCQHPTPHKWKLDGTKR